LDDTAPRRPETLQGHQQFLKSHPASPLKKKYLQILTA
jgi:hypothetical protein